MARFFVFSELTEQRVRHCQAFWGSIEKFFFMPAAIRFLLVVIQDTCLQDNTRSAAC